MSKKSGSGLLALWEVQQARNVKLYGKRTLPYIGIRRTTLPGELLAGNGNELDLPPNG